MPHTRATKMPYNANVDRFWVWLVWGIRKAGDSPELIAIATSTAARDRYLAMGRHKAFFRTRAEMAWLDHAYGESLDLSLVSKHAQKS